MCLNRTSVGLKQQRERGAVLLGSPPQSNQRGIETRLQHLEGAFDLVPQSNQRGIETHIKIPIIFYRWRASIEPAWD